MSDTDSDSYASYDDFAAFTETDFAQLDAALAKVHQPKTLSPDSSFQFDLGGIDFNMITAQEFAEIDADALDKLKSSGGQSVVQIELEPSDQGAGEESLPTPKTIPLAPPDPALDKSKWSSGQPAVQIEVEPSNQEPDEEALLPPANIPPTPKPWHQRSPMEQFRPRKIFSVTDLVSPSWCEVQYDYGLRGKRSRPIHKRPKTFKSASGKTISVKESVAKTNDVRTKQGLAVHKELEREIRFEELKVDIVSEETRWALRIVNMLACLKGIITDGFTREMPIFGIVHDEIVVGIIDEVVKKPISKLQQRRNSKRPSDGPTPDSKRSRTIPSSVYNIIQSYFHNPPETSDTTVIEIDSDDELPPKDTTSIPQDHQDCCVLYLKDNKTRKSTYLPSDEDSESGRLQLMLYRRLASELLSTSPVYDFTLLWKKLDVNSATVFPTQFLVQANLITPSEDFQATCLDDLVVSWHKLVQKSHMSGVDPQLELVYRLRPPGDYKGKSRAPPSAPDNPVSQEEADIARAIAASLEDTCRNPVAGPSNLEEASVPLVEAVESSITANIPSVSEEEQMQWALQQSLLPQQESNGHLPVAAPEAASHSRNGVTNIPLPEGIDRFKIIGTKVFDHDDQQLDAYLTNILKWWRGERQAEGVSVERSYRCSSCEYSEDCEWRAAKALEHRLSRDSSLRTI